MFSGNNIVRVLGISSLVFGSVLTGANIAFANSVNRGVGSVDIAQASNSNSKEITPITIEENDFRFQFQGCQRKGQTVDCNFVITNIGNSDRQLTIFSGARAFDSLGNEYKIRRYSLGNKRQTPFYSSVSKNLVKGIAIKSVLIFEISPEISDLTLVEMRYSFRGRTGNPKIQIRDVKITQ